MPFILSWTGSTAQNNPIKGRISQPFSQSYPVPQPPSPGSHPGWGCLHSLGGAAERGREDSLHRWYCHFLMICKKGKANFYLRVLVWSRQDHVPWHRLHSDGPLPSGSGGQSQKWAGVRISPVHCQQWTRHRGRGATKMTTPVSMAGGNTAYGVSSKGRSCLGGVGQGGPEEVLLQG